MSLIESFGALREVGESLKLPKISQALDRIISHESDKALVSEVKLYLRKYNVSLEFIQSSNSWNACLSHSCDAVIVVRFNAACHISSDFKIGKSRDGDNVFHILIAYNSELLRPSWTIFEGEAPHLYDKLSTEDFENAESMRGLFPLAFIRDYMHLAESKVFTSVHNDLRNFGAVTNLYEERDFSTGLFDYLHHLKGMQQLEKGSFTMESVVSLLRSETEHVVPRNKEIPNQEIRIKRIY